MDKALEDIKTKTLTLYKEKGLYEAASFYRSHSGYGLIDCVKTTQRWLKEA
jgi:hypothetical protein